ncbi:MAG: hypothetical protein LQ340_002133 [Diploschistes diacapsis]|nr:MAG: hypothetical protein LQ340_002133 [Diploschistes diacapsis]
MRSVVSMDPKYLALHDGSDEASGRGSGLGAEENKRKTQPVPYMHMLYAPLERRLDTAIFRSLFASSVLQARQFCVHGYVRVNGKKVGVFGCNLQPQAPMLTFFKMVHPGYHLNPGDMFQVDPERVLLATGAIKTGKERRQERRLLRRERSASSEPTPSEPSESTATRPSDASEDSEPSTTPRATLQSLLSQAKTILAAPTSAHSASRKRELRAFQRQVRSTLSNSRALERESVSSSLSLLAEQLSLDPSAASSGDRPPPQPSPRERRPRDAPPPMTRTLRTQDEKMLAAALQEARDNPIDPTKAYATPWRPRPYMSAFAFIPRYLEVHHTVCSAVYLRHPVAKPGLGEVPTPFGTEVNGLAFNWYLRRR